MVLNKEKSKEFKRVTNGTKFKKGMFVAILFVMLLLSGCSNKTNGKNNVLNTKVYQPGEHKVFYITSTVYGDKINEVCAYPNVATPEGYELVDTQMAVSRPQAYLTIIFEYENIVPVEAEIIDKKDKAVITSFGTPLEKEDKALIKNLQ